MPAEGPPLGFGHTDPHLTSDGVCVCSNSCCLDPYSRGNPCVCIHCKCRTTIAGDLEKA